MIGRIPIQDIHPVVDCGRRPAKAAAGETFEISATVFREGHDAVAAGVVLFDPQGTRGPLLRMRELVGLSEYVAASPIDLEQVVVIDLGDRRAGLVIDELTGQEEIVVKQYDAVRDGLPIFGGATLLSDGRPALIVDVSSLL